jgi:molybdopterin-biosynthesis enzyme MoeA-like protein
VLSRSHSAYVTEGTIAAELEAIQRQFPNVEIGSYPFIRQQKLGVSLVARGTDEMLLDRVSDALADLLAPYDTAGE